MSTPAFSLVSSSRTFADAVPEPSDRHPLGGPKTVLLLEDDEGVAASLCRVLVRQGYCVLSVTHPDDALELARAHPGPIHLLISDLVLPKMSGSEVADRIAVIRPGIRVLLISGYLETDLALDGILGNCFLAKPFTVDVFLTHVHRILSPMPEEPRQALRWAVE